jgi:hypothetical protein
VSEYSFIDSHAERRMRDAERSGDRFPDYPPADPAPPPKGETGLLGVPTQPDAAPSLRFAVAMSKLAKAVSAQGPSALAAYLSPRRHSTEVQQPYRSQATSDDRYRPNDVR